MTYCSMVGDKDLSVAMLAGVNLQCTIIETYNRNLRGQDRAKRGMNASHVHLHIHANTPVISTVH